MSKRTPDLSFERDGRSLAVWLRDLVAVDDAVRLAAGQALQAMMIGLPCVHTKLTDLDLDALHTLEGQAERFTEAVRAAVAAPGFPVSKFVRRLIEYRIKLQTDWELRVDRACRREEAASDVEDRLAGRIESAVDESERAKATDRFTRWVCARTARDCKRSKEIYAGAESMTAPGYMASTVFGALDKELLEDRAGLRTMLNPKLSLFSEAVAALARIGPPALDFADVFLDLLDAGDLQFRFGCSKALGSIGRNDPAVIDALLQRLRSGSEPVRKEAAAALGFAGPPLAGRLEVALDLLLDATHAPEVQFAATAAVASVGRFRESALQRVLELAAPRPPRWRTLEGYPEHRYDETMYQRGVAIESLRHFPYFVDRVMPTLIDAFDTFDEYDPDWSYNGEHCRVCWTLKAFGPQAAPVVPRLVRYLREWLGRPENEREWPKDAFGVLISIGTPATAALPILEHFRATFALNDESLTAQPLDAADPLERSILVLRGDLPASSSDPMS
jgi:HEAT repeat protein